MAFDGIVTRAISYELRKFLLGGKVEKIYQPERDELVFFVHGPLGRVRFYASSSSEHCGIYMTDDDYKNPDMPPALCMLMRKHLQGSRIVDIYQTGSDRMIEMLFESRDEMGFTVDKKLVIEIMGRHSNIVLIEKETGRILGAVKHITGEESRARQILPGGTYEYPPAQGKIPFDSVTAEDITGFIDDERDVSKALLNNISGISPVMARYLAYGSGEPGADPYDDRNGLWRPSPSDISARLSDVLGRIEKGDLDVTVYLKENGTPADFSVVKIPEYEARYEALRTDTVSSAIAYYYSNRNTSNRIRQKSQALSKTVTAALPTSISLKRATKRLMSRTTTTASRSASRSTSDTRPQRTRRYISRNTARARRLSSKSSASSSRRTSTSPISNPFHLSSRTHRPSRTSTTSARNLSKKDMSAPESRKAAREKPNCVSSNTGRPEASASSSAGTTRRTISLP